MPMPKPVLTMAEQKELEKAPRPGPSERSKALKKELAAQGKAMAGWRPCWCWKKVGKLLLGGRGRLTHCCDSA